MAGRYSGPASKNNNEDCIDMKELKRMMVYTIGAVSVIFIMIWLARQEALSSKFMVSIAVLLIVVIPIAIGVVLARRERQQRERGPGS